MQTNTSHPPALSHVLQMVWPPTAVLQWEQAPRWFILMSFWAATVNFQMYVSLGSGILGSWDGILWLKPNRLSGLQMTGIYHCLATHDWSSHSWSGMVSGEREQPWPQEECMASTKWPSWGYLGLSPDVNGSINNVTLLLPTLGRGYL